MNTATYLVNRSPFCGIYFKTLEEVWSGKKPSLSHLRVLGCAVYAHQREGELDPRAIKCIFLGYDDGTKGYRLWSNDSNKGKLIISRDVVFNENIFPCLETNPIVGEKNNNTRERDSA